MKAVLPSILCLAALAFQAVALGSDHADPMSLNAFFLQEEPLANITDLHAFVVDKAGTPLPINGDVAQGHALVVSTCVRRKLLPTQTNDPELEARFAHDRFSPAHRSGLAGQALRSEQAGGRRGLPGRAIALDQEVAEAKAARDAQVAKAKADHDAEVAKAKAAPDAAKQADAAPQATAKADKSPEQTVLEEVRRRRGRFLTDHQLALRMDELYGGTIESPELITEEIKVDFHLSLERNGEDVKILVTNLIRDGLEGPINNLSRATAESAKAGQSSETANLAWQPDTINVQAGIFDDPFIFPRFFRGNVIGIVTSIPLKLLHRPDGRAATEGAILLWATTHDKRAGSPTTSAVRYERSCRDSAI